MNAFWLWDSYDIVTSDSRLRRGRISTVMPSDIGLDGCRPSEFELPIIAAAREAVRREIVRLGLKRPLPPDDRIHVLDDADFTMVFGEKVAGMTYRRNVYLRRLSLPHLFLSHVAHELCHGGAFLSGEIRCEKDAGERVPPILDRRIGLSICSYNKGGQRVRTAYEGLNEGVTDILAHRALLLLANDGDELLPHEIYEKTMEQFGYMAAACVIIALTTRLDQVFARPEDARDQLFRDYLTGSTGFVRALTWLRPDAVKTIAAMPPDIAGAVDAAKCLGLEEALDNMAEFGVLP